MQKRREEIKSGPTPKGPETPKVKKDIAGVHAANHFEVIISTEAHKSIADRKSSYEAARLEAKRTKSEAPAPDLNTILCIAVPGQKDIQLTNVLFGTALRNILPQNSTLDRIIKDSTSAVVDKVEFSCDDKGRLLPAVVSLRFKVNDKATGENSELMYRCKVDDKKIHIKKLTDSKEYKKNYYESSNNAGAEHIHTPKATHKD